jgi:hypothetical protein
MKLEIHKDNSAQYRWTLAARDGHSLGSSTLAFPSYEAALRAAEDVRDHADSVTIETEERDPEAELASGA